MSELIKVFKQLYVGFKPQQDEKLPLAFATPYEENSAGMNRKKTVDNWANQPCYQYDSATGKYNQIPKDPNLESKIVDNNPIEGFRIAESIKRCGWNGGNVVWRIEDPRGWELEISSANLAQIIDASGINSGGLIPGKCIWGRLRSNNLLIPENTPIWNKMIEDQKLLNEKKRAKAISGFQPGDLVKTKTGEEFIYYGRKYVVRNDGNHKFEISKDPYYVLVRTGTGHSDGKCFHLYRSNPIVQIITPYHVPQQMLDDYYQTCHLIAYDNNYPLALADSNKSTVELCTIPAANEIQNFMDFVNGIRHSCDNMFHLHTDGKAYGYPFRWYGSNTNTVSFSRCFVDFPRSSKQTVSTNTAVLQVQKSDLNLVKIGIKVDGNIKPLRWI